MGRTVMSQGKSIVRRALAQGKSFCFLSSLSASCTAFLLFPPSKQSATQQVQHSRNVKLNLSVKLSTIQTDLFWI